MSDQKLLWNTLDAARSLLWRLLVEQERGTISLPDEWKREIDTCEKICGEVLGYVEQDPDSP